MVVCVWLFVFTVTAKLVLTLKKEKGSINNEYRKRSPGHQRCGRKEYIYTHMHELIAADNISLAYIS